MRAMYRNNRELAAAIDPVRAVREAFDADANFDGRVLHARDGIAISRRIGSTDDWIVTHPDGRRQDFAPWLAEVYGLRDADAIEDMIDALSKRHASDPVPQSRAAALDAIGNAEAFARAVAPKDAELQIDPARKSFARVAPHPSIPAGGTVIDLLAATMPPDSTELDVLRQAAKVTERINRLTPSATPEAPKADPAAEAEAREHAFRPV